MLRNGCAFFYLLAEMPKMSRHQAPTYVPWRFKFSLERQTAVLVFMMLVPLFQLLPVVVLWWSPLAPIWVSIHDHKNSYPLSQVYEFSQQRETRFPQKRLRTLPAGPPVLWHRSRWWLLQYRAALPLHLTPLPSLSPPQPGTLHADSRALLPTTQQQWLCPACTESSVRVYPSRRRGRSNSSAGSGGSGGGEAGGGDEAGKANGKTRAKGGAKAAGNGVAAAASAAARGGGGSQGSGIRSQGSGTGGGCRAGRCEEFKAGKQRAYFFGHGP